MPGQGQSALERGVSRDMARSGSKSCVRGLPVPPCEQVLRRVPRRSRDKPGSHMGVQGQNGIRACPRRCRSGRYLTCIKPIP
jgi:hypothetical protein